MTQHKRYEFLRTVQGSRDGLAVTTFNQGEVHELDESLAEQFFHLGAVTEASTAAGGPEAADPAGDACPPADRRETKVIGPEETKPHKPLERMSKAELVTHAATTYGLELTPDTLTMRQMIAAIRGADPA